MTRKLNFCFQTALVVISLAFAACGVSNSATANRQTNPRNMNESNVKTTEVKTSIEELEKQINLSVRPSEVKWVAEIFDNSKGMIPGPNDYRLTALLKYDDKTTAELVKKLELETSEKSLGNTDIKEWFPEEVKNSAKTMDNRKFLEGAKYQPKSFFRGTYQNGDLIKVGETNYFVLNLFSF
ncbi:MAG TPA: hypothetical protein PKY59_04680 [Pyrinomonadaceae bacterium]|nr:hypothetical protein [Pyrinomonadaceae bacterium]